MIKLVLFCFPVLIFVACSQISSSDKRNTYIYNNEYIEIEGGGYYYERLLLVGEGGIRVDFHAADLASSIITSAKPKAIHRIVRAFDALANDSSISKALTRAGTDQEPKTEFDPKLDITIRWRSNDKLKVQKLPYHTELSNNIWNGILMEIDAVGSVELLRAIYLRQLAISSRKEGNQSITWSWNKPALHAIMSWSGMQSLRYNSNYEKELTMHFEYLDHGQKRVIDQVPYEIMDLPGMTYDWANKFTDYAWDQYTQGLSVTSLDNHINVVTTTRPNWSFDDPVGGLSTEAIAALCTGDDLYPK